MIYPPIGAMQLVLNVNGIAFSHESSLMREEIWSTWRKPTPRSYQPLLTRLHFGEQTQEPMPLIDSSRTESTVELIASECSSLYRSISCDVTCNRLRFIGGHISCCIITCKSMQTHAKSSNIVSFFTDSSKTSIDSNTYQESKNRLSFLLPSECVKRWDSVVKTRYIVFGENSMRWNQSCSTEGKSLRVGLSSTHGIGRPYFELFGPWIRKPRRDFRLLQIFRLEI